MKHLSFKLVSSAPFKLKCTKHLVYAVLLLDTMTANSNSIKNALVHAYSLL